MRGPASTRARLREADAAQPCAVLSRAQQLLARDSVGPKLPEAVAAVCEICWNSLVLRNCEQLMRQYCSASRQGLPWDYRRHTTVFEGVHGTQSNDSRSTGCWRNSGFAENHTQVQMCCGH